MLTSTAQFTPKWGAQLHRNIQPISNPTFLKIITTILPAIIIIITFALIF